MPADILRLSSYSPKIHLWGILDFITRNMCYIFLYIGFEALHGEVSLGAFDKLPWVDPMVLTGVSPWQKLIKWSHSPSCGDAMHLRSPPSDPFHKQGTGGWPGWAPSKLFERTGADQGRPREAKRTHPIYIWSAVTPCVYLLENCLALFYYRGVDVQGLGDFSVLKRTVLLF